MNEAQVSAEQTAQLDRFLHCLAGSSFRGGMKCNDSDDTTHATPRRLVQVSGGGDWHYAKGPCTQTGNSRDHLIN